MLPPVVMGLVKNPKIIAVVVIAGFIWYKYADLTGTIEHKQSIIEKRDKRIGELEKDKLGLQFEKNDLTHAVNELSNTVNAMEKESENSKLELALWKDKPPEIKYKTIYKEIPKKVEVYKKGVCEDGLELNRVISEMNYEDL